MHSFSTAAAMLCVVLAGGCGGVKGPDIVGTWNSKLKNPSSGIEVTIEMVVKANKTFTITYVASEIGRNDKQTGTWRAKSDDTVELEIKEGGAAERETAKLVSPDTLELNDGAVPLKFQRKRTASTKSTK